MSDSEPSEITRILKEWNEGNESAKEELLPVVYGELKRQARYYMSAERRNHTLQPTALVHEAFLRLEKQAGIEWRDSRHFFGIASRLMRQILVDFARQKAAKKRGDYTFHFSVDDLDIPVEDKAYSLIALNEALEKLAKLDKRQAKIVEMRFFGGLSNTEISEALEISDRTIGREWKSARLWLHRELNSR